MHAAGLAAHELQRIGILLLRHQAAAGRRRVGELEEPELLRREQDQVLGHAGSGAPSSSAHACRNDETKSRSPVASMLLATTREKPSRVGEPRARRSDSWCRRSRRSRAAARRSRASTTSKRAWSRRKRRGVREEEVRDEHRLRAAQVRVRRHQRVAGASAPARRARRSSVRDRALQLGHPPLQVEPQIDARPARCAIGRCAAAGRRRRRAPTSSRSTNACTSSSCAARSESKNAGIGLAARENLVERRPDRRAVGGREHAGALERLRPGQAAGHVVLEQPAIEPERGAEREQLGVGIAREPS